MDGPGRERGSDPVSGIGFFTVGFKIFPGATLHLHVSFLPTGSPRGSSFQDGHYGQVPGWRHLAIDARKVELHGVVFNKRGCAYGRQAVIS